MSRRPACTWCCPSGAPCDDPLGGNPREQLARAEFEIRRALDAIAAAAASSARGDDAACAAAISRAARTIGVAWVTLGGARELVRRRGGRP
jgi:hypothetical protein